MRRFWLVLLSLGLIAAFSTSAMAVDVKFSGEFYAAGLYLDQTTLVKDNISGTGLGSFMYIPPNVPSSVILPPKNYRQNVSTAFFYQRLRLNTTFVVHPGLFLTTRCDIMERAWGASRSTPGTAPDTLSVGTRAENENIAFDLAYLTYISPIGIITAGYQLDGTWGTVFGNSSTPVGKVGWYLPIGPFGFGLQVGKVIDNSLMATNPMINATDRDHSFYTAFGQYKTKNLEAGLLFKYQNLRQNRADLDPVVGALPLGYKTWYVSSVPYFNARLGRVALQGEVYYTYGEIRWEDDAAATRQLFKITDDTVILSQLSAWLDATVDFGMAYVGGTVAYLSGDDPGTKGRKEGNSSGGLDWNPCLIMFNSDLSYWAGDVTGYYGFPAAGSGVVTGSSLGAPMQNAWFFQGRAGVRPVDKLDIMASVSFANADKKPTANWRYNDYGWEVDLTATYKITNNLSYMLGAGYFFTGKYYKADLGNGTNAFNMSVDPELRNNYMVLNKLTLTF